MCDRKRKTALVITLAVLLASITVTGSQAYFSTSATARNIITSGGVSIALEETSAAGNGEIVPYEDTYNVMPGTEVSKIVQVRNTGNTAAWVCVQISRTLDSAAVGTEQADLSLLRINMSTSGWTERDGLYYYNEPLKPGESTEPVFTAVAFDGAMGNPYQNATASVSVTAYGVQTANNGDSSLNARGWPLVIEEKADEK